MIKKRMVITAILGLLLLTTFAVYQMTLQTKPVLVATFQFSSSAHLAQNVTYSTTVQAERTALAVFTQNPTLALSSTPFYAEIIFNEVMRNVTEIPFPPRPCYLSTANVPANLATPITECGPFVATILLAEQSQELTEVLQENGIDARAGVQSTGLQGIDNPQNLEFVAVEGYLSVSISVDSVDNRESVADQLDRVISLLVKYWHSMVYVSTNADIYIEFVEQDGDKRSIVTTYAAIEGVIRDELSGETLFDSLGGLSQVKINGDN